MVSARGAKGPKRREPPVQTLHSASETPRRVFEFIIVVYLKQNVWGHYFLVSPFWGTFHSGHVKINVEDGSLLVDCTFLEATWSIIK